MTNKLKHGEDFYKVQGAKGGRRGHTGGFFVNRKLARIAGAKGGRISKRRPAAEYVACPGCNMEVAYLKRHIEKVHPSEAA